MSMESEPEVWSTEEDRVVIKVGEEEVVFTEEVTADTIIRLAKEKNIKKFRVKMLEPEEKYLRQADFPIKPEGKIVIAIEPYTSVY